MTSLRKKKFYLWIAALDCAQKVQPALPDSLLYRFLSDLVSSYNCAIEFLAISLHIYLPFLTLDWYRLTSENCRQWNASSQLFNSSVPKERWSYTSQCSYGVVKRFLVLYFLHSYSYLLPLTRQRKIGEVWEELLYHCTRHGSPIQDEEISFKLSSTHINGKSGGNVRFRCC